MISRRTCLSIGCGCLRAAALLAAAGLPFAASGAFLEDRYDVIVVGGGGAGLAAAVSAAQAGASVLLIEKTGMLGGNTLRASGLFNVADPARQSPLGIKDSAQWHFKQTLESSGGRSDPQVIRRFTEAALPTIHWLESLGMRFLPGVYTTWGAEWPRGHKPLLPRGQGYIRILSGKLLALGGEIRLHTKLRGLVRDPESGRITGVVVESADAGRHSSGSKADGEKERSARKSNAFISARRGVVLAAGGYAQNKAMLARYAPQYAEFPTDNAPGSTGEAIFAAKAVGAKIINLDCVQTVPGAPKGRRFQVRLDLDSGRVILVDGGGRRFIDEDTSRDRLSEAIISCHDGAYSITDDAAVNTFDLISKKDIYRGLLTGDAVRAPTLDELAKRLGLPADALRESVAAFNEDTRQKRGKCSRILCAPIAEPPFWGSRIMLNVHSTMGGVAISPDSAVLDGEGRVIPGLFAAGEIVGNLHGRNRIGGNGIGAAITMGRIAGENAAAPLGKK